MDKLFGGKYRKAITFSYDDGVRQDERLIRILDRYGLKCTFNLNTGCYGAVWNIPWKDRAVDHIRFEESEIAEVYKNHELAVHTLHHPNLSQLADEDIIREVEEDRQNLMRIVGKDVPGMAYPGGTGCMNRHVADLIRDNTGVKYSRTTTSTHNFELQTDLLCFNPTVYHMEWDEMERLGKEFLALETETPKLFYVWGHAYEFDMEEGWWDRFEAFCESVAGRDDVFYGTNTEVLL